ncbi:MAG: PP2C family protein-serine/threonine phosphatase, partial [Nitrospinota bacterium]
MPVTGGWLDNIAKIHPIKLINRGFVIIVAILLLQTILVSIKNVREIRDISENAVSDLLTITRKETANILKIMENPSEIYTVDPLLKASFHNLKDSARITSHIVQAEVKGLPEGFHTTPEKVEYWIDNYKGEYRITREKEEKIRQFLPFLKAREENEEEEHDEEEGVELETVIPQDEYDIWFEEIKTNYKQIVSKPIVDIYFNKKGELINVYAALKRDDKKCVGCHGYLGNRPVLIHFSKDLQPEIAAEKQKGITHLLQQAQSLAIVVLFYLISYFLLRASLTKREEQREKMENALAASVDVLKSLRSSPRLMPFFVTSPSYVLPAATGGGDSVHWHDYRHRYAGYCLHDVSGHDIQETLLNIYATAVAGSCKINPVSKQVATPAFFLTNLNRKIYKFCSETPAYGSHFLTVIKILMDFTTKKLMVSLAGHPKPLLIRPDGSLDWVGEEGLLLGQFDVDPDSGYGFVDTTVWLEEGEILLVYSDGLMEQKNRDGVMFSAILEEKVAPKLAGKESNEAYAVLQSELEAHLTGTSLADDITFTFFGARPNSRYESCQYLFLDREGKGSDGEEPGEMVRGLDYDGKASEEVFKPEFVHNLILDTLREHNWHEKRINDIKQAIEEVLAKIIEKNVEHGGERQVSVRHVVHNDVLEIEINCGNGCFSEEMHTKGSVALTANRYGSSLLLTRA